MSMDTIPADLEQLAFERSRMNEEKLLAYGFLRTDDGYEYSVLFHDDAFRAVIKVSKDGEVSGTVIEEDMQEEYLPLRVASQTSAFVSTIRQEYYDILCAIRDQAFDEQLFRSGQANRLAARIQKEFADVCDFPFENDHDSAVFRVPGNRKWYGIIMHVERAKVQKDESEGIIDVINLKADENEIEKLLCEQGIFPAWHMNKKKWISVILDDTLKDDRVFSLIKTSRKLVSGNASAKAGNEWIVPANPKYYDIKHHFRLNHVSEWKQSIRASIGDIVYVYSAAPDSAILYKTIVVETDIPYEFTSDHLRMKKLMRLKVVKKYPPELLTMNVLRTFGVRSMQGSKRVPLELKKVIDSLEEVE